MKFPSDPDDLLLLLLDEFFHIDHVVTSEEKVCQKGSSDREDYLTVEPFRATECSCEGMSWSRFKLDAGNVLKYKDEVHALHLDIQCSTQ